MSLNGEQEISPEHGIHGQSLPEVGLPKNACFQYWVLTGQFLLTLSSLTKFAVFGQLTEVHLAHNAPIPNPEQSSEVLGRHKHYPFSCFPNAL